MKKSGTKSHNRKNFSIYHLHGPFFFHVLPHNNVVFTGFSWVSRVCMLKRADRTQRYICHFTLLCYRILNCTIFSFKRWCYLYFIKLKKNKKGRNVAGWYYEGFFLMTTKKVWTVLSHFTTVTDNGCTWETEHIDNLPSHPHHPDCVQTITCTSNRLTYPSSVWNRLAFGS